MMVPFFNSSFFVAASTLSVGFFAIYLYIKQKKDYKRDAAKIILQEIRYAEQKIRKFREVKGYRLYDKLLPTNSWNDNIHLFIKELKEVQNLDLISDFYGKAIYIDTIIAIISRQKNNPPLMNSISSIPPKNISPMIPLNSQVEGSIPVLNKSQQVGNFLIPLPVSQKILDDVSMNVEFIYNTPVVDKLREISEKKWYQLF